MLNINNEILQVMPDMRRTVAKVLRASRYYSDDHIEECMGDVMLQAFDYGAKTFDPLLGSVKSHFTTFARRRAINWLNAAHRRFEMKKDVLGSDGEHVSVIDVTPGESDPLMDLMRARDAARIRAAIATLQPRERALIAAYLRLQSWGAAGREVGMSAPAVSRMKAKIVEQLR